MPLETKAENEQEQLLLLLEPQEFLQGAVQLTQVLGKALFLFGRSPFPVWDGLELLLRIIKVLRVI